jgi:phospholipid/cholesterol/gamma-HCH transport system substrate-binding protein
MRRVKLFACGLAVTMLSSSCALMGIAGECDGPEIIGRFEQVADLVVNSNVQSSDVVVGSVKAIELEGWDAQVTMCLNPGEKIPADVRAVVRTTSLLGEKFIDLQPQTLSAPYLEDGDIIGLDSTGKSVELEEVFGELSTILGTGELEKLNQFTSSQAKILRGNVGELRNVLRRLHEFTDTLSSRRGEIAASIDNLDSVARTILGDTPVLTRFLRTFAGSSSVLADQKDALNDLLFALDRFSNVSVQLLNATEGGLNEQFEKLRPVLRTVVENSQNLVDSIQTLATFSQWFPESMPGDYLQLDVCQAVPEDDAPGLTCPQSDQNDDPDARSPGSDLAEPKSDLDYLLNQPVRGRG